MSSKQGKRFGGGRHISRFYFGKMSKCPCPRFMTAASRALHQRALKRPDGMECIYAFPTDIRRCSSQGNVLNFLPSLGGVAGVASGLDVLVRPMLTRADRPLVCQRQSPRAQALPLLTADWLVLEQDEFPASTILIRMPQRAFFHRRQQFSRKEICLDGRLARLSGALSPSPRQSPASLCS